MSVVAHAFTKRIWLPSIFLALEVCAVFLGLKLRSIEREMAAPRKRSGPRR